MKFFTRLAVLFYVTMIMFVGAFLLTFVLQWVDIRGLWSFLSVAYVDANLRLMLGVIAVAVLLINFIFYQMFSVDERRDKIIAFDNPSGRVSVSLAAMEDIIKKVVLKNMDVKDVRSSIRTGKKGLQLKVKLALCSAVNIPEITSKVQDLVKDKIQDMIGLDEPVNVSIYVGKIFTEKLKSKESNPRKAEADAPNANIPFQGYRA